MLTMSLPSFFPQTLGTKVDDQALLWKMRHTFQPRPLLFTSHLKFQPMGSGIYLCNQHSWRALKQPKAEGPELRKPTLTSWMVEKILIWPA
jgi:hypothetical protein